MYYFIGIKGAGMSSLAIILKKLGYEVMGSDVDKHFFTEKGLDENNIKYFPYNKENIRKGYTIIKGLSIKDDHEELVRAKQLGLTIKNYNEMVGELTRKYKTICVAGCHGKTTTTSMISHVLNNIWGVNYLVGDGSGDADNNNEFFVLESCEYQRHFLEYLPYYAIITNIDLDHVDYFKDIDDVVNAYQEYANKAVKMVIACGDDKYSRSMKLEKEVKYYGLEDGNDIIAKNVVFNEHGTSFDVMCGQELYGHFDLPIFGKYQLLDSLACISVCYLEKINAGLVNKVFRTFKGARRRFTEFFVGNNVIIDDYAHHPKEVEAMLEAVSQKYKDKKIIIIFQPHTFTRTKEFASDLIKVFNKATATYIMDIHPARENALDYPGITSDIIIKGLNNGYHLDDSNIEELSKYDNAVFMFMSPNDVSKYEDSLMKLKKNGSKKI